MGSFRINGGKSLKGVIYPQGAKNEALQILCAVLLSDENITIENVPDIKETNYNLNEIKFVKSITTNTVQNLKRTYYLYVGEIR